MAISRGDFCFFITELVMRNPNPGIPPLEDALLWLPKNAKLGPFGHGKTFGGMVRSFSQIYCPWGPPGTRVMTIFGSHVVCEGANPY